MKKKNILLGYLELFILALSIVSCINKSGQSDSRVPERPPNIIILLVDDAGYADFGFMGSKDLETPNIDKLADRGVVFTDAHVSATVCAPSRAGLITGRYQQRFGHECNIPPYGLGMDTTEVTLAYVLKDAGYATAIFGKWHLGLSPPYHPCNRGFDEFFGFLGGSRSYFPYEDTMKVVKERLLLHNWERAGFDGYLTDVLGEKAIKFIDENKKQPFFIFLSFNAVHTPMHAKKEHLEKYKDHPRRELAAMTWSLDENIGKVIDKLEQEGLMNNTLIFFLSDNGGATNNQSSCAPLKGWKGNKFEGGHRVPFFSVWPEQIPGGGKIDGIISSLDIFTTSVNAAGIEEHEGKRPDGINLLPYLTGDLVGDPHARLYWRKDKMAAAREGNYKLIRLDGYGSRMYNLENDLGETIDLHENQSEKFNELKNGLSSWESGLIEPLWLEGEDWNKVNYEIHQALIENREPNYKSPSDMKIFQNK